MGKLICNHGHEFDEAELAELYATEPYQFWGEQGDRKLIFDVCPVCGSDVLSEVEEEIEE